MIDRPGVVPLVGAPVRPRRRAAVAVAALLGAMAVLVAGAWPASAHALVKSTFPADGAVVDEAPVEVSLAFNEGVDAPTAAVRVYDDQGDRVDLADARVDPEDDTRIVTSVQSDLDDGTYIVTWRAVSADGHPVKGAWLFSVGEGGEIGDDLVAALFQGGGDRPLAAAAVAARAVATGATLLLAGVGLFLLAVVRGAGSQERQRLYRVLRWGAVVGLAASVLSVPLQAMLETGLGLGALAPGPLGDVLGSPVGLSALARAALLSGLWWLLRQPAREPGPDPRSVTALGTAAVLTWAFEGHSLTQQPIWAILLGDVVHVLAAAAWAGGIVALLVAVRSRRRADDPVGAATMVAGFSRIAMWSLLAVTVAGGTMGWVTVRAARALTSTGYGVTLLVKLGLVAALALVGLYNRRRLVPAIVQATRVAGGSDTSTTDASTAGPDPALATRIGDGAWIRLRQTLRIEALLIALVVAVTGLLVGQQPASQEAGITGAFTTYVDLSADHELNVVVDPNRAGLNEIHIYVLDRGGRPVDAEEVRLVLEQPARDLGPFERVPEVAGPGHWSLAGRELAVAGEWRITIVVRTGTFSEEQVTVPVVVNP